MKAYLIDPAERSVRVEHVDDYHHINDLYRLIQCNRVGFMPLGTQHTIYVDDEALLHGPTYQFFAVKGGREPVAGRGLVFGGVDPEGNDLEPTLTIPELSHQLVYIERLGQDVWSVHPAANPKQSLILKLSQILAALDAEDERFFQPAPPATKYPLDIDLAALTLVYEREGKAGVDQFIKARSLDPQACYYLLDTELLGSPIRSRPPMTTESNDKGRLTAFKNLKAAPDNKLPAFEGTLTLPGSPDSRRVALWAKPSKDATTTFTGRITDSATTQIAALTAPIPPTDALQLAQKDGRALKLEPNSVLIFQNTSKTAAHPDRSDYWGYVYPSGAKQPFKVSLWAKTDKNGNAYLSGPVETQLQPTKERDK